MTAAGRVLAVLLGLLLTTRVHVVLWLPGGAPVSVRAVWPVLAVAAITLAVLAWLVYAVPRLGRPRLIWRTVTP